MSSLLHAEVTGRFDHAGDANALVYSPLATRHTYHATRRYLLEIQEDAPTALAAARAFIEKTLVEEVSQQAHFGETPALTGFYFILDYGFKPGALDLERETILGYYRGLPNPGFTLNKLTITQRLYIFAENQHAPAEKFVRDIVNPAIHRHQVIPAA
jgi:hypothetical protein